MVHRVEPLRVLIVDDEAPARRLLRRLLGEHSEFVVVGESHDGHSAVDAIRTLRPDLVLLDIQMPSMDGMQVVATVGVSGMPAVIFVTAYDQYAVKAFEAHAFDYLLKPFTRERFGDALERVSRLIRTTAHPPRRRLQQLLRDWEKESTSAVSPSREPYLQRLLVKSRDRIIRLEVADIHWIQAADHYVVAFTAGGKHLVAEKLSTLENSLPPDRFVRVHRGAIVNVAHVQSVSSARFGACSILMSSGTRLRLSRSRRAALQALLTY